MKGDKLRMDENEKVALFFGVVIVFLLGCLVTVIVFNIQGSVEPTDKYLKIDQETGNDLCIKITENKTAIAKDYWDYDVNNRQIDKGKIACELPSYDHTHNIVVRSN